jgi:iron complex transport system ATP-binding protein
VKTPSRPILAVDRLSVARGSTTILRNLSWQVEKGEHWVILGPNGSGKTSLLKVLTGYMPPTEGSIDVFGRTYGKSDWRDLRKRIGIVSSSLQISIPLAEPAIETVISGHYAQLDLWAKITAKDRRDASRLLRRVGLEKIAQREWMHLSQGERQRVLIARALMARPELLILDEPCAGLDPVAREHFLGFIERLARSAGSPALMLVTHHVEEVTSSFSHALLLRQGGVVSAGPLRTTLTSARLSATFGAPVRLARRDGKLHLVLPRTLRSAPNL